MIALIHIYCSTSLCVIYKSLLIHDIQVLIYRGSTNERLPGKGVAYDSYYNETDRVTYILTDILFFGILCQNSFPGTFCQNTSVGNLLTLGSYFQKPRM